MYSKYSKRRNKFTINRMKEKSLALRNKAKKRKRKKNSFLFSDFDWNYMTVDFLTTKLEIEKKRER